YVLCDGNLLCHVHLGVGEMGSTVVVAAGVSKLAVDRRIATGAAAGAGIDDGSKGVRVEPLPAAGLRHAGKGSLAIKRKPCDPVGKLRTAPLKNAVVACS